MKFFVNVLALIGAYYIGSWVGSNFGVASVGGLTGIFIGAILVNWNRD